MSSAPLDATPAAAGRRPRLARTACRAGPALIAPLIAASIPLAAQEQPTQPTLPPHFAITNARIVTVTGPTLEDGTVVVRNGVIRAVGDDIGVPSDAWIVDGEGLTVYPGLIDGFGTLGHPSARDGAAAGDDGDDGDDGGDDEAHSWGPEDRPGTFTWTTAADGLDADDDRIAEWREAGFTTALTTRERGLFPGQAAVVNLAGERGRAMVVEPSVAQRINLRGDGYDGYPGSLMGSFAYIKQLYLDADHYDRAWSAYERDPRGMARPEYDRTLEPLRDRSPVLF
ncbi:MAG: hypothetical protein ACODAE_03980, partial [Gemmatimonadota bacterium]